MDGLCREVLLEHRPRIVECSDTGDAFLNQIMDHLLSKHCLQDHQRELILAGVLPKYRCRTLLYLVEKEGSRAFHELCNALDCFATDTAMELAKSMRNSLRNKQWRTEQVKLIYSFDENKSPVFGLTTLNNKLYVVYQYSQDIVVFDTNNKFSKLKTIKVPEMNAVRDMTSCSRLQVVYIVDGSYSHDGIYINAVVHRVENDDTITKWPVDEQPVSLSVNSACNILVTCHKGRSGAGSIKEFTTEGKLIREIKLQSDIKYPNHTVELTANQYVVSYGEDGDTFHRVCIVNTEGRILQWYGGLLNIHPFSLNEPARLAVNGDIFVADSRNLRVAMLSPTLSYIREVVSGCGWLTRLCFDEQTGRLYVGLYGGGWKVYSL